MSCLFQEGGERIRVRLEMGIISRIDVKMKSNHGAHVRCLGNLPSIMAALWQVG